MVCCVQLHHLELVLLITLDGQPHPQLVLVSLGNTSVSGRLTTMVAGVRVQLVGIVDLESYSYSSIWSIWKHRHDCIFNGHQLNLGELCELVKVRGALWVKFH
ncbi:unnamed protein product [Camellia sinensis]